MEHDMTQGEAFAIAMVPDGERLPARLPVRPVWPRQRCRELDPWQHIDIHGSQANRNTACTSRSQPEALASFCDRAVLSAALAEACVGGPGWVEPPHWCVKKITTFATGHCRKGD